MIEIKPSSYRFDKSELKNFQKDLGVILPDEYINFLKSYNGGVPQLNFVEIPNGEIKSFSITEFFGINHEKITNLKSQYEIYKERIPKGNIPICRAEGGNIVCLNIYDGSGSVNFWDHDTELLNEDIKTPFIFVASNFNHFLNLIKPNQGDNLNDYKVEDVWINPEFLKEIEDEN